MPERKATSKYEYLLEDDTFKRWFQNVRRGSLVTGYDWLRRVGWVHKKFGKTPSEIASLSPREAGDFLLDVVGKLEEEGRSGGYIANIIKPLKSWLEFNGKQLLQRIKVPGRGELVRVGDERPPTQEELGKILGMTDFRRKVACSLVAFSGLRLEVLGDYLGNDGLQLRDFPEIVIEDEKVDFKRIPTVILVRRTLSKTGNQYFTFLCDEGCEYLKQYLEWRLRIGEKLTPKSPIITPTRTSLVGEHIRTLNIGDLMRKAIRNAGFQWRPYVFRRYFDTGMMMAESKGLIIRDWRVFWMGHKGDIENTYTVNKGLPENVIDGMRESYAKAAEQYLVTRKATEGMSEDQVKATFNKQFLEMAGYSQEEINELGDLSQLSAQQMQELIQKKSMQALGLNGKSKQKIVPIPELKNWITQGWEFVSALPTNEAIIRLP